MEKPDVKIPLLEQPVLEKIARKCLDLPYAAQSVSQKLDLYYPETAAGLFPWWYTSMAARSCSVPNGVATSSRCFAFWNAAMRLPSVEYRLSGEARFPAPVYDCKAAIRFLRANAARYRLDAARIGIWGPSAGGYLAAMVGATNHSPAFEDLSMGNAWESSAVQAVVDWCGPCGDFTHMDRQIRENGIGDDDHDDPCSPESRLLGHAIQQVRELSRLAAPVTHVSRQCPPFLIHHGEADPIVPVQQSFALAAAVRAAAGEGNVTLRTFPGRGHHGQPWYEEPALTKEVLDFLDIYLKK